MSDLKPAFDAARHCDAMAPALGLVITQQQRPAVLQFLAVAKAMSEIVFKAPLDDAAFEPAGVFRAGEACEGEPR